ncbi:hypothetical protein [Streptomyces sp. CBMA152]|uniref:hypothetical protein n=1 Tax=Streptomyces sp. CBMA152 TaxID=1896312 RepID=UPI0016603492|nr:hypothetical protein [Streptomyces sp. CBMA152]MBD0743091.1 hypothetical protein [Streptomyces sp. CBMA152]
MRRPLILAAAAALLCAACTRTHSDAGGSADAAAAVRDAVTATSHTSARFTTVLDACAVTDWACRVEASGTVDLASGSGRLTVGVAQAAVRAEEVLLGDRVYMRPVVVQDTGIDVDQRWAVGERRAAEAHAPFRAPLNDPSHSLAQVTRMQDVRARGTEAVHGVQTTRYQGTLDHAALTLRLAKEARAKIEEMRELYGRDLPVTAEAWVDTQGRLVQARFTLKDRLKDSKTTHVTYTLSLTELGAPVRVTPPSGTKNAPPLHDQMPTALTG